MMSTVNKENEVTNMENTQVEVQAVDNQQPVAVQPEEKKEGLGKKIWNKVKKPLLFVGIAAGAFGAGVATDHFVLGKNDSNQGDANGADTATETTAQ